MSEDLERLIAGGLFLLFALLTWVVPTAMVIAYAIAGVLALVGAARAGL